jgi:phospholipid/cholesterol/gamma-HCH transport system substrate-binding protein
MFTHYFKVGIGVIIAAAILAYAYVNIQENRLGKNDSYTLTVVFDNVEGLSEGNAVWLSGLKIGSVKKMQLLPNGKVELSLVIDKKYKIHKDSTFSIRVGILEEKVLSIEKPAMLAKPYRYYKDKDIVKNAESPITLQSLVAQADSAMTEVNKILVDARQFTENEDLRRDILATMSNVAQTTAEAHQFVMMMNETGRANRANIDDTLANVDKISKNLVVTTAKVDDLIAHVDNIVGDETFKQELKETMSSLKETMSNLKDTSKSIRDMATDEQLKTDVKDTIKSTKATMENADVALRGFSKMIKAVNETEVKPDFEFRYESHIKSYFADMNLRIFPPESKVYYLIGLDDLGEASTTNLQFAISGYKPDTWFRVGIKSGKLGVGAERTRKNMYYEAELSDPNDLQFNLRGGRQISGNTYMLLGWERVFKKDSLSLGVLQRY